MEIGKLVYKITGDSSGLNSQLKKTDSQVQKTGKGFSRLGGTIKGALVIGAAVAVGKFVKSLVLAGSEAEEVSNKFGVVFSSIATEANASARELADSYGLSRVAAKQLLSDTGDLLTGFGFTQDEALKTSDRVNKLAVDLASFTNFSGGAAGASAALTKALLGERESIKSLGIAITEADLKTFAEQNGQVFKELTRQEKAALTLELAYKQSANAIGDFERSQNSFANQVRIAQANLQDQKQIIGEAIVPLAGLAVKAFNNLAAETTKSAEKFAEFVRSAEGAERIGEVISRIVGAFAALRVLVQPVLEGISTLISDLATGLSKLSTEAGGLSGNLNVVSVIANTLGLAFKITGSIIVALIDTFINLSRAIRASSILFNDFKNLLQGRQTFEGFSRNAELAGSIISQTATNAKDSWANAFDNIGDASRNFSDQVSGTTDAATKAFQESAAKSKAAVIGALTAQQEATDKAQEQIEQTGQTAGQTFDGLSDRVQKFVDQSTFGLETVGSFISAFSELSAANSQADLARLEQQKEAALEAAGVQTETAVEKAQKELEEAKKSGNKELQVEKEQALKRAQIEEDFQKKQAKLEYEAALRAWKFDLANAAIQIPRAALNTLATASRVFLPPIPQILAAGAAGAAGIQFAAIQKAKPVPAFAEGGVVPGSSFAGDNVTARVNSGEMILNRAQQAELFRQANGGGGGNQAFRVAPLDKTVMYNDLFKASQRGELFIAQRAVR